MARGRLPAWLQHYNVELLDRISFYLDKLGLNRNAVLRDYKPTKRATGPVLQHGMKYALAAQSLAPHPSRVAAPGAAAASSAAAAAVPQPISQDRVSTVQWLAQNVGIQGVSAALTVQVVEKILGNEALLHNPAELSRVAKSMGCPLELGAAKTFAEKVLLDDSAYVLLKERSHAAFLRRLHAVKAPPPVHVPVVLSGAAAAVAPPSTFGAAFPPQLAAIGAQKQVLLRPEALPAPPMPPAAAAAAAAVFVPEGSPAGGDKGAARAKRLDRNRNGAKRAAESVEARELRLRKNWERRNPGKVYSERPRKRQRYTEAAAAAAAAVATPKVVAATSGLEAAAAAAVPR